VLKYTLGALAAAAIVIGAAFVILAQVTGGGADAGPARTVIVSTADEVVWPLDIQVDSGEIIYLQLNNESSTGRVVRAQGKHVEQLPEAPGHEDVHVEEPSGIYLIAEAGLGDGAYVRFNEPGEYSLDVLIAGVFFPIAQVKVTVR
jgi:hypothetical protein